MSEPLLGNSKETRFFINQGLQGKKEKHIVIRYFQIIKESIGQIVI